MPARVAPGSRSGSGRQPTQPAPVSFLPQKVGVLEPEIKSGTNFDTLDIVQFTFTIPKSLPSGESSTPRSDNVK